MNNKMVIQQQNVRNNDREQKVQLKKMYFMDLLQRLLNSMYYLLGTNSTYGAIFPLC